LGLDPFVLSIFAWALIGFGNVYYGLAQRVGDLALAPVKTKTALALTRPMSYHPAVQFAVADMMLPPGEFGAGARVGRQAVPWHQSR
jgi:alkylation response protein AidB-like acyl-CoA dehydrogenase